MPMIETFNAKPSVINDPFKKSCVTQVSLFGTKSFFGTGFNYTGSVSFTQGDTEGKQKFTADSMDALYTKVSEFVKTLQ